LVVDSLIVLASAIYNLWVPRSSSMSRGQAIFVDQAIDASLSSDAVLLEIDRFALVKPGPRSQILNLT
jgi:hypothetical protein